MAVPISQMWTVASYVLRQKLAGRKRYPLVLIDVYKRQVYYTEAAGKKTAHFFEKI